ncbi:MAG: 50S ribosomal protein L13 [Clostridiales bacterium]|jgi:large subunit ribosomal protein L13|nr:50S ribosomal protein L13 [Clostridiales bacterium]MCI2160723.1 50S ribosomal protein L13 [Oscillospiraceae bacterium]CAB1243212.1 ribosomal protein L13 [Ruminococcaceae bacterium BL-4]MCI1961470.1 50S ribosomal protein L13 [Clostridiales bacterium]MCI2022121.1 50S ribosomal protein L13 [Clostridiales bacterium]
MSTYMPKAEAVERKWYVIDAAGKPLGRVASQAALLLRGKHKTTFAPHVDCGDHVIIVNCAKAVLTGNKLEQKHYYHHTGYIGHLKDVKYDTMMREEPCKAMELAVKGMLPKNTIGRTSINRLRLFEGEQHGHTAQQPTAWEF